MIAAMLPRGKIYDVVVIGGGPAGMMAAGTAAERGASVVLLEKNQGLGKKLLITGGGRCNVTNNKPVVRTMLSKYEGSDQFLFSAFTQHGVAETLKFFHDRGMPTKEENDGRLFPVSNTATSVWEVLVSFMQKSGVEVRSRSEVEHIRIDNDVPSRPAGQDEAGAIFYIKIKNVREEVRAKKCIVATGGTSHPETGSTGEGFKWLKKLGHTTIENDFALVPVVIRDAWAKKLGGVALTNIKINLLLDGKRQSTHAGKVLFTHFGLSGPTILNMAREIGDLLRYGEVVTALDLFPKLDQGALRRQLQTELVAQSNKQIKNVLGTLLPSALVAPILELTGISGETPCHSVSTEQRTALVVMLKQIPLHVEGLLGAEKAIVSSGGVSLPEVNFKTMQSRLIPNLYLIGDILNINRPSGGYSLQLCWTTGYVAGSHAGGVK
jgi:predicted Rossmann fold flavoprotein